MIEWYFDPTWVVLNSDILYNRAAVTIFSYLVNFHLPTKTEIYIAHEEESHKNKTNQSPDKPISSQ